MGWVDSLKQAVGGAAPGSAPGGEADKRASVETVIRLSALGAAAITYAPLPFVDFVAITPMQAAMVAGIGRIRGRELSMKQATDLVVELASVCGAALLARQLFTTATKVLLPGLGGFLAGPYAFAVTWAMGRTADAWFLDPTGNKERLAQVFEEALAEGKRLFSRAALDEFRRSGRAGDAEAFTREAQKRSAAEQPSAAPGSSATPEGEPAAPPPAPAPGAAPRKRRSAAGARPPRKTAPRGGAPRRAPASDGPEE